MGYLLISNCQQVAKYGKTHHHTSSRALCRHVCAVCVTRHDACYHLDHVLGHLAHIVMLTEVLLYWVQARGPGRAATSQQLQRGAESSAGQNVRVKPADGRGAALLIFSYALLGGAIRLPRDAASPGRGCPPVLATGLMRRCGPRGTSIRGSRRRSRCPCCWSPRTEAALQL